MYRTKCLYEAEKGQTFPCYERAADLMISFLEEDGVPNIERSEFPADGKTSFQDKRMPLAWDASVGRLTLLNAGSAGSANAKFAPASEIGDRVADYDRNPFHLVKGSTATPPGGVRARILTEAQFLAGDDCRGALVMLEPETWPRRNMLTPILDRGALGFITDFLVDRYETPDAVQWVQACSETRSWHVDSETRPFIGFSVSPRTGGRIRTLASRGNLWALAESDGHRYEGTFPGVTALIPGKRRTEYWILTHLFEPLATDDANGAAAALETARLLLEGETPEFSIRLVFGLELYGFAAYIEQRGGVKGNVIGGCNFDSTPATHGAFIRAEMAGPAVPFYGGTLMEMMADSLRGEPNALEVRFPESPEYYDDLALGDPLVGVPLIWPLNGFSGVRYWHNSAQDMSHIDPETFRSGTAFSAALSRLIVSPQKEWIPEICSWEAARLEEIYRRPLTCRQIDWLADAEIARFSSIAAALGEENAKPARDELAAAKKRCREEFQKHPQRAAGHRETDRWYGYARGIFPARKTAGFCQDLTRVPKEERIDVPDDTIYGPLSNVVANMDGNRSLAELIDLAEAERGIELSEKTIKRYANVIGFLAEYGYFEVRNLQKIGGAAVLDALKNVGVRQGDFLLVHSALSEFGHIDGGNDTVLDALREAVGSEGTVLFPAFNRCYRVLGSVNTEWSYRPYSREDLASLSWLGRLPIRFLRRFSDAPRSAHYTHSWTGFGKEAQEALAPHQPDDPPASERSPMGEALRRHGKILHFGSGLESTTFLHYLEDQFNLPGLGPALVGVREPDGSTRDVLIPNHLPGDREFYRLGERARFFQRAVEAGLVVSRVMLGPGELKLLELDSLWDIGKRICGEFSEGL